MPRAKGLWDAEVDGRRLRAAREDHGHNQVECALALRELGLTTATQSVVSRYESGRQSPFKHAEILQRYIEQVPARPAVGLSPRGDTSDEAEFDRVVRSLTNEPLLGELQEVAVKAMIQHLQQLNEPMSQWDHAGWRDVLQILGMGGERP